MHDCLDSILLLKSRLSGAVHLAKRYSPLPPVTCYVGQLSQVFINLFASAIELLDQAVQRDVADKLGSDTTLAGAPGQITITTQMRWLSACSGLRWVSICTASSGSKLLPAQQQQMLDSFSIEQRAD